MVFFYHFKTQNPLELSRCTRH